MSKRKILWFTNTASLYQEKLNGKTILGGWIPSLEKLCREADIDLRLAFHHPVSKVTRDEFNGAIYYLIPGLKDGSKLQRLKNRWLNTVIDEEKAVADYLEVVNDFKPDLVQIWGSEMPYGLVIPYLKVPHVLHVQGNLAAYYQMFFRGISRLELQKARTFKDWINRDPYFYTDRIFVKLVEREKKIMSATKNFFGRTTWDKRIVEAQASEANYMHCDEILRDAFYEYSWKPSPEIDEITLVSVFRDSIYKGIETVLDSVHLLNEKGVKLRWNIIGVDRKSNYLNILNKSRPYALDSLPIYYYGYMDAGEMIKVYEQSDIFVHTSHIDNSPNSVCEAMMIGLPVITTNVGGIPSLIEDEKSGMLFQDGDSYALAGAVLRIRKDYQRALGYAAEAKSIAMKRHDKKTILKTLLSHYEKLINGK